MSPRPPRLRLLTPRPAPKGRQLATVVETIPGVLSLEPFFDALYAVALRLEREASPHDRAA